MPGAQLSWTAPATQLVCPAAVQAPIPQTVLTAAELRHEHLHGKLCTVNHVLLQLLSFEGGYTGRGLPAGKRSLLLRARIGDARRTLPDADIKEFSRKKSDEEGLRRGFRVKLLEGDCDWPAVMAALREINYTGWGTAEIPGGQRDRLREIAERMDRIFAS